MIEEKIEQYIKPTLQSMGYECWGCQYIPQGNSALLRIYIDKADGIGIEDCERASRQIAAILDVEDPIPGEYRLEISSPGIPRPLFYNWQYQRYLGKWVEIRLSRPIEGQRKFSGIIMSADEHKVVIKTNDESKEFLFSTIAKAQVEITEKSSS